MFGHTDGYVELYISNDPDVKYRTTIVQDAADPVWEERFVFDVAHLVAQNEEEEQLTGNICFDVYDDDDVGDDEIVGSGRVPLRSIATDVGTLVEQIFPLRHRGRAVGKANLLVSCGYATEAPPVPAEEEEEPPPEPVYSYSETVVRKVGAPPVVEVVEEIDWSSWDRDALAAANEMLEFMSRDKLRLLDIFAHIDEDKSGSLDRDEVEHAMLEITVCLPLHPPPYAAAADSATGTRVLCSPAALARSAARARPGTKNAVSGACNRALRKCPSFLALPLPPPPPPIRVTGRGCKCRSAWWTR